MQDRKTITGHSQMEEFRNIVVLFAEEQNWTTRNWSSDTVRNVMEIMNTARIICLRTNTSNKVIMEYDQKGMKR